MVRRCYERNLDFVLPQMGFPLNCINFWETEHFPTIHSSQQSYSNSKSRNVEYISVSAELGRVHSMSRFLEKKARGDIAEFECRAPWGESQASPVKHSSMQFEFRKQSYTRRLPVASCDAKTFQGEHGLIPLNLKAECKKDHFLVPGFVNLAPCTSRHFIG